MILKIRSIFPFFALAFILNFSCAALTVFSIPSDAELMVGTKSISYKAFDIINPDSVVRKDNFTEYTFSLDNKAEYNYRICGEFYVTHASRFEATENLKIEFSEEDLLGDKYGEVSDDGYFESNILLNTSKEGCIDLKIGEEFSLFPMRTWQTVEDTISNYFFEPDFNYEVVFGESVSVSKNGIVTAIGYGMSVVQITYNALCANSHLYGALRGAFAGVAVFNVGEQKTFDTGINLDSDFESVYYIEENENAEYTFTPEDGCEVFCSSINDFEFHDARYNDDKSFTVTLQKGRNIIKILKNGISTYHVITARPLSISIDTQEFLPEKTVKITLAGLSVPVPKIAGVYNFHSQLNYTSPTGALIKGTAHQYDFITAGNTISVKLPTDYDDKYVLKNGKINVGMGKSYGKNFGFHRNIDPSCGLDHDFSADVQNGYFSILPDIVISKLANKPVEKPPVDPVEPDDSIQPENPGDSGNVSDGIFITFALIGDTIHGDRPHRGSYPVWIEKCELYIDNNSTVSEATQRAFEIYSIESTGLESGYLSSITIPKNFTLSEFDNGPTSGWMYKVNGVPVKYGIDECFLSNGDDLVWHFSDSFDGGEDVCESEKKEESSKKIILGNHHITYKNKKTPTSSWTFSQCRLMPILLLILYGTELVIK